MSQSLQCTVELDQLNSFVQSLSGPFYICRTQLSGTARPPLHPPRILAFRARRVSSRDGVDCGGVPHPLRC